jgi:hypothetical protein
MNLAELKKEHRSIFCSYLNGMNIYWRPLTLREYDIYFKIIHMGLVSLGKVQDQIFREVVLSPDVIDDMYNTPAGLVPSLVDAIFLISGNFLLNKEDENRMNNDIDEARKSIENNPYEQFVILICKAFPSYTPFDIEKLEYQEMLRLLIMAEKILPIEPIKLKSEKKEKKFIDTLFEDKKKGEYVDHGAPVKEKITDRLSEKENLKNPSYQQARQIEMIRRIKEQRGY